MTRLAAGNDLPDQGGTTNETKTVELLPNQFQQLLRRQSTARGRRFEEAVGQVAFCGVQGGDPFFDRAFGDEPVDRHGTLLAQAVGAVGSLVLHRRVPPGVHVQDVVGRRQVRDLGPPLSG